MKLGTMELLFLTMENDSCPQHIMALTLLEPPNKGESAGFAARLYQRMLASDNVKVPFNYVVDMGLTHLPRFITADRLDMSQHIRLAHLPAPGNDKQLNEMVSEIQVSKLDRSRPLWELWLIDGLEDGQVAMVTKLHHAIADGQGMGALMGQSLSATSDVVQPAFWTFGEKKPVSAPKKKSNPLNLLTSLPKLASKQIATSLGVSLIMRKMGKDLLSQNKKYLPIPFVTGERSPFNANPSRERTYVRTHVSRDRVQHLAKLADTSSNNIILTLCDIALQHYLKTSDFDSKKPLTAMMPVSLRSSGTVGGNQSIASVIEMGEIHDSPLRRLFKISRGTSLIKDETINGTESQRDAFYSFSMMVTGALVSASVSASMFKADEYLPSLANVIVSNVPGPASHFYFMGAKVSTSYPVSVITSGASLNITLNRYADNYCFGIVACPKAVPNFEPFDTYLHDALEQLESEVKLVLPHIAHIEQDSLMEVKEIA